MDLSQATQDFSDLVERDLKGTLTPNERVILHHSLTDWRDELLKMKRRAEQHMTSSRTRAFDLYRQQMYNEISQREYIEALQEEKVKRTNTSRFLQQIEHRLIDIRASLNDDDS